MKVLGSVRPEGNQIQRAGERSGSPGAAALGGEAGWIRLRAAVEVSAGAACASSSEPPLAADVLRNSRRFIWGMEPQIAALGKHRNDGPGLPFMLGCVNGSARLSRQLPVTCARTRTDRKSTRLNSSHLGISYA